MKGLRFFPAASAVLSAMVSLPALAAQPLAPPAMYPEQTWKGKSEAVLRVLNRLDAHVEVLHVPAGAAPVQYQTLSIGVARCLQNAPTLRPDAAVWLDVQNTATQEPGFHGWMLAAEPSVGIYESPLYDIRVVSCDGTDVPPPLPELEKPAVPPLPGKQAAPAAPAVKPGTDGPVPLPPPVPPGPDADDTGDGGLR